MGHVEIDSTADKAFRVTANDVLLLFQDAVFGMFESMAEPKWKNGVLPAIIVRFQVEAIDYETLLVSFLEEVLFKHEELGLWPRFVCIAEIASVDMESSNVFVDADIVFADCMEPYGSQVKAVTYHDLRVIVNDDGSCEANITLDV